MMSNVGVRGEESAPGSFLMSTSPNVRMDSISSRMSAALNKGMALNGPFAR